MSGACTIDTRSTFTPAPSYSASEEADWLKQRFIDIRRANFDTATMTTAYDEARRDLEETKEECSEDNWDGYGARPVQFEAYVQALRFLDAFPETTIFPSISADPYGDITFEWHGGPNRVLCVSLGANGLLTYAGLFGPDDSRKGTVPFGDELPGVIAVNIRGVFA